MIVLQQAFGNHSISVTGIALREHQIQLISIALRRQIINYLAHSIILNMLYFILQRTKLSNARVTISVPFVQSCETYVAQVTLTSISMNQVIIFSLKKMSICKNGKMGNCAMSLCHSSQR